MQTYTNLDGEECVSITNEDDSTWSGLKSAYDAQVEHLTERVTDAN